jgi:hypothetical protein
VFWSEQGVGRLQLLASVLQYLNEHRWGKAVDSGWSAWDLEVYCHPWTIAQVCTAEEDHGHGRRLTRVRYRLRASNYLKALATAGVVGLVAGDWLGAWIGTALAGGMLAACLALWTWGTRRAAHLVAVVDAMAAELGLVACASTPTARPARRAIGTWRGAWGGLARWYRRAGRRARPTAPARSRTEADPMEVGR